MRSLSRLTGLATALLLLLALAGPALADPLTSYEDCALAVTDPVDLAPIAGATAAIAADADGDMEQRITHEVPDSSVAPPLDAADDQPGLGAENPSSDHESVGVHSTWSSVPHPLIVSDFGRSARTDPIPRVDAR